MPSRNVILRRQGIYRNRKLKANPPEPRAPVPKGPRPHKLTLVLPHHPQRIKPIGEPDPIQEYKEAVLNRDAERNDIFWRCAQGGLCNGR